MAKRRRSPIMQADWWVIHNALAYFEADWADGFEPDDGEPKAEHREWKRKLEQIQRARAKVRDRLDEHPEPGEEH